MQKNVENINMLIKYREDPGLLSNVCLFSSFSFSGIVEEYVFHYLEALQNAGFSIVFISTSPLIASCTERLSKHAFLIIERENTCPDFGSWKAGLSLLNWGKNLDSVLLANDSVFGPFFNIADIISTMKEKHEVWGMTENNEIDYHLQSYFLYFNRKAVNDEIFSRFWKEVDVTATKEQVIHRYEVGLSALFKNNRYHLGAYAQLSEPASVLYPGQQITNPMLVFWKTLIEKHRFPFLKRELLIKPGISRTYRNINLYINTSGWRRTVKQASAYPVELIMQFMTNYQSSLPAKSHTILQKRKIVFIAQNTRNYGSQQILVHFMQWLKDETSLQAEIVTSNKEDTEQDDLFAGLGVVTNFPSLSNTEKRQLKERLADEAALIVSGSVENISIQKFFASSFLPQAVFVYEEPEVLKKILSAEDTTWLKKNIVHYFTGSNGASLVLQDELALTQDNVSLLPQTENDTETAEPLKILQQLYNFYDEQELMLKQEPVVTFMTHIYYENSWEEIKRKLKNFDNGKNYFLFSISSACLIKETIIADIRRSFDQSYFLITSNIGKDIGGKMALIDIYLLLDIQSDYVVFLHDKQSPHSLIGESWKNGLFKIIDPNYQPQILRLFNDPRTGIVGDKDQIINEYNSTNDTFRNNSQLSKKLMLELDISIDNYDFLGGSIYWIRSAVINKFFRKHNPIAMRQHLEAGNVMDLNGERLAHTWERMFSWIATNEGFCIKGI